MKCAIFNLYGRLLSKWYKNEKLRLYSVSGQQVVEEILDAQRPGCPPEYFNISVPKDHPHLNPTNDNRTMIPLLRSRYDMGRTGYSPNSPREQVLQSGDGSFSKGLYSVEAEAIYSGG